MDNNNSIKSGFSLALDKVHGWSQGFYTILPNMAVGLVVFIIFIGASYLASRMIATYFRRRERADLGRFVASFFFWALILLGALIVLTIIIPSLKPVDLLSSLGFGSLAFGFAFKDILQNWMAGLLILLRLPFRRGDQITVGIAEGTVQRVDPRATIIRSYDGRDIVVPNTTIYTNIVTVHTSQEIRRIEIDLTIGYSYDIRRIMTIIQNAMKPIKEVMADPPVQVLCWDLGATSLGVKIRWWINSERSQEIISRARVVQAIKEAFEVNDIDPTDPQLIYYQETVKAPSSAAKTMQVKSADTTETAAPPPEVKMSKNDPETDKHKADSKNETLLPEN